MSDHQKETQFNTLPIKHWLHEMSRYRYIASDTLEYIESLESTNISRLNHENELLKRQVINLKLNICELKQSRLESSSGTTGEHQLN